LVEKGVEVEMETERPVWVEEKRKKVKIRVRVRVNPLKTPTRNGLRVDHAGLTRVNPSTRGRDGDRATCTREERLEKRLET